MILERVEVSAFRNLTSVSLSPTPGLNILEGSNGSGKTSFLESIYMLAMARSFRTHKSAKVVQHGHQALLIFSIFKDDTTSHKLGIQNYIDNRMQIKLDGELLQSRSKLVQELPVQIITPESISLLTGSPNERRQYLDWIMFHVEPSFHLHWTQYQRALKQRNVLVRQGQIHELPYWNSVLIDNGEKIDALRSALVTNLQPFIDRYVDELIPGLSVTATYRKGWRRDFSLEEALTASVDADISSKYTTVGPHRSDLIMRCDELPVIDTFSRGQLKLLLCALKLAQLDLFHERTGKTAVVLVDDLPAELDSLHRKKLLTLLHELHNQVFITTTDRSHLDYRDWEDVKVFHVEHGIIKEVV